MVLQIMVHSPFRNGATVVCTALELSAGTVFLEFVRDFPLSRPRVSNPEPVVYKTTLTMV